MKFSSVISLSLGLLTIMALVSTSQTQAQSYTIETIAITGDPAPGTSYAFSSFDFPLLSANGKVAFKATLDSTSTFDNGGIWIGDNGSLELVIQDGDTRLRRPQVNGTGSLGFLRFDIINSDTITVGQPGNLSTIVHEGDIAPGTNQQFTAIFDPTLNEAGEVAFGGRYDATANAGLWAGNSSNLGLVARHGGLAPGTDGLQFKAIGVSPGAFQHNNAGQVAFSATLDTTNELIDEGIWVGAPGQVILVARTGDLAPGTNGQVFTDIRLPGLNSSGQIVFTGEIDIGDGTKETAIWLGDPASPNLLLRPGDEAPGTNGLSFKSFPNPAVSGGVALNASGDIGFPGRIETGSFFGDLAYWAGKGPALDLVVREGDPAPGVVGEEFQTFTPLILNALGEVAFLGGLATGDLSNRKGIWVWRGGELVFITRQTETIEVALGDTRTVTDLFLLGVPFGTEGNDNGVSNGFNDVGQITFYAEFQDGSQGIFLATPGVIADAGADRGTNDAGTVILDGSGSFDPGGTSLEYSWALDGGEIGTGATPTVGPFAAGEYAVKLTVTDADGDVASNVMVLTVLASPVADAGADFTVNIKGGKTTTVTLDGSGSSDADGTIVSYVWSDADGVQVGTGVTADVTLSKGTFAFTLLVTDNDGLTASDDVVVTAAKGNGGGKGGGRPN